MVVFKEPWGSKDNKGGVKEVLKSNTHTLIFIYISFEAITSYCFVYFKAVIILKMKVF
jgi:hypothetical protein